MDDNDDLFGAWFTAWLPARPEMRPLGWYTSADLEAAFNAGMATADGRPGQPVFPPQEAGPVPQQD